MAEILYPIIEIEALSKTYVQAKKEVLALQDVSLNIQKGDVYGIIGHSGAGKSTLIRCLSRLVKPTSGRVLFEGKDLKQMDKRDLRHFRHHLGMIFQHFNLLGSRTVASNIAYPMEVANAVVDNKRVEELLRLVGLEGKKEAYPSQLSGGEKQRVGIARALANHPKVLLCDEATASLDPKTTREILSLLKNINKNLGVTIVLITHEMEVLKQICNKVAVMEKGEIVEEGEVAEVFAEPKHPMTKSFLQSGTHEIPLQFFKPPSLNRKLLRLRFKGAVAGEPIISEIVRKYGVDANILLGWVDHLQTITLGTLVIELTGSPEGIKEATAYLQAKKVAFEELENE